MIRCCVAVALSVVCTVALSCATDTVSKSPSELMVFAAMSLKKPMTEVVQLYEKQHPGVKVNLNFAGTGSLVAQVIAGAPADIFASASMRDMEVLCAKGGADQVETKVFATNSVVLVVPAGNMLELKSFRELALDKVRRVAVGNPRLAPVGAYARDVISYFGIEDQVKDKLIYCDQVAQVCDYTARGEVDAGVIYLTDYLSRADQLVLVETAPAVSHMPVEYPVALIKGAHNKLQARQFIDLLCSKQGAELLATHGFGQLMEAGR